MKQQYLHLYVKQILEYTSVNRWNPDTVILKNPTDRASILQDNGCNKGSDFLKTKDLYVVSKADIVGKIEHFVVTMDQFENSIPSLALSLAELTNELSISLILFDKLRFHQKIFCTITFIFCLISPLKSARVIDGSIPDPVEHDKANFLSISFVHQQIRKLE